VLEIRPHRLAPTAYLTLCPSTEPQIRKQFTSGEGGRLGLFSADISSLFLSAYWWKVPQLLNGVKAVS
jgi:hypothetical protein